ncbi:hypothetical protein AB832_07840 [Flavobacteriaceae bacterium (ex Bugula neritina AB1)]|nr:hypothetical protein AB832_07840 [Flavobacteriaceae bacterium (ex Bugula neritina AB1)]
MANVDFWELGIKPKVWTKEHSKNVQDFIKKENMKLLIDFGFKADPDEDFLNLVKYSHTFRIWYSSPKTLLYLGVKSKAILMKSRDFNNSTEIIRFIETFRPCDKCITNK